MILWFCVKALKGEELIPFSYSEQSIITTPTTSHCNFPCFCFFTYDTPTKIASVLRAGTSLILVFNSSHWSEDWPGRYLVIHWISKQTLQKLRHPVLKEMSRTREHVQHVGCFLDSLSWIRVSSLAAYLNILGNFQWFYWPSSSTDQFPSESLGTGPQHQNF